MEIKTTEKIKWNQELLFEKVNKRDKSLARLNQEKKRGASNYKRKGTQYN